jgi:hypothetical protein
MKLHGWFIIQAYYGSHVYRCWKYETTNEQGCAVVKLYTRSREVFGSNIVRGTRYLECGFSSVPVARYWDSTSIRPRVLSSKSISICHTSITQPFDAIWSTHRQHRKIYPLLSGDCRQRPLLGHASNVNARNNRIVFSVLSVPRCYNREVWSLVSW